MRECVDMVVPLDLRDLASAFGHEDHHKFIEFVKITSEELDNTHVIFELSIYFQKCEQVILEESSASSTEEYLKL